MSKFTHLHLHTEYSLLDGLGKIPAYLKKAKELGMESLAITDHGSMYGAIKFYLKAKEAGIKPIIGCEVYVAPRSRLDKQPRIDADQYHLLLLAKNTEGYKNLLSLVTKANLEGYYYKPRVDLELLRLHHEGLIASSACIGGQIPHLLRIGEDQKAKELAKELAGIFGEGNFYLELQHHDTIPEQEKVNKKIVELSRSLGLPLVATADVHYVEADDAEAQKVLLCVQMQKTLPEVEKDKEGSMFHCPDLYLRSAEEMSSLFADYPEAIANTQKIADQCNLEIETDKWILPQFPLPEKETAESYLRKLCQERIGLRFSDVSKEITDRMEYELSVIEKKGYAPYFLIVQDFVNWAKKQGIRVGPGRGSAAGSLVSYVLRITSVDPLFFKLPFERFLNVERPSPPDIDLDFSDDRRDEVISYVTEKYGSDRVAQIITFGTMEARGSIRDVGRVLGMPYSEPDKIAKLIPFGSSIKEAIAAVPELKEMYNTETKYRKLLDLAQKLEGVARHASTHAAGVVIADKPLVNYTALQKESKGERIVTQYDMYTVGEGGVGLLKMDFLGLRNLSILEHALENVVRNRGEKVDLSDIPLDDKLAYQLLGSGETTGIFQLESSGMRKNIKELKPTNIFDLAAMVALYRPGPLQIIPEFITRKHNPNTIKYPDPRLKETLKESYGLIVYQDDVLLTAIILAGYSWAEADGFRKAMGKKIKSVMEKQRDKFISGCVTGGMSKEKSEELFHFLEPFAGYAFNKAHASCYATIAYQTAYMKAHFPVEFMTAILTAESGNNDKVAAAILECRRTGLEILPPHINYSNIGFAIEKANDKDAIRFGLSAIKNIGEAAIASIVAARDKGGKFKSLMDFVKRVDLSKVNRKTLESLIKAGACDGFGKRAAQLAALDQILERGHNEQKQITAGQTALFDNMVDDESSSLEKINLPDIEEFSHDQLLSFEKDLLGFYLSEHPQLKILSLLDSKVTHKIGQLDIEEHTGQRVLVAGIINDVRRTFTKAGNNEMAFVKMEDEIGNLDMVVFPKIFSFTKDVWVEDQIALCVGRVDNREGQLSLIVENAISVKNGDDIDWGKIEEFIDSANRASQNMGGSNYAQRKISEDVIQIFLPSKVTPDTYSEIREVLREHNGQCKITLIFRDKNGQEKKMVLPYKVDYSSVLVNKIEQLIGENSINLIRN